MAPAIDSDLRRELDAWADAGKRARLWWRDDDAISDTPALRRLLAIARETRIVVALAAIPARADASLAALAAGAPCCIWQHGLAHEPHAHGEFGEGRALEAMASDAVGGQTALDRLFGPRGWQRVFVPPFHALAVPFKMLLPGLGYRGLSAGAPLTPPIAGLREINADIEVIDWRDGKFLAAEAIGAALVEQLAWRRTGRIAAERPIGLLTHHRVHDAAAWEVLAALFGFLGAHGAVELLGADTLFAVASPAPLVSPGGADEVSVVVTSCGRQDLLDRTLDSFLRYNTFPVREIIVIEDGDAEKNRGLMQKYQRHPLKWLATGTRVGQIAAIDIAYGAVQTEFIFHCEDDWEFTAPGFIEKSLAILRHNAEVLQVWIRALDDANDHPISDYVLAAEEVPYRLLEHDYEKGDMGIWHGFSFNPGLRRRREYRLLGRFGRLNPDGSKASFEVERAAGQFYRDRGFLTAILADHDGKGYVSLPIQIGQVL